MFSPSLWLLSPSSRYAYFFFFDRQTTKATTQSPQMRPTTRSQVRRKSLRSYFGWEMFKPVMLRPIPITPRKMSGRPQKLSQKPQQIGTPKRKIHRPRLSKRSRPTPSLINNLPYNMLRAVLLNLDERTLLLNCQRVCKTWAAIISGLPLKLDVDKFRLPGIGYSLHLEQMRARGTTVHTRALHV